MGEEVCLAAEYVSLDAKRITENLKSSSNESTTGNQEAVDNRDVLGTDGEEIAEVPLLRFTLQDARRLTTTRFSLLDENTTSQDIIKRSTSSGSSCSSWIRPIFLL
jgi:hypothetical protein